MGVHQTTDIRGLWGRNPGRSICRGGSDVRFMAPSRRVQRQREAEALVMAIADLRRKSRMQPRPSGCINKKKRPEDRFCPKPDDALSSWWNSALIVKFL